MNVKELISKVQEEIISTVNNEMPDIKNCELSIVEDDFILQPDNSHYSNTYIKINRSNYTVEEFRTYNRYSLSTINNVCKYIVDILMSHKLDFDKLFGVKLESVDDFIKNVEFLLDAGIEKRYVIGKIVKRSYGDSFDEYGIVFDPSCFFDISFTEEDKQYFGKSHMRCYIEFDKNTINTKDLADFLIKIVEKNKDTINKYVEEYKNE